MEKIVLSKKYSIYKIKFNTPLMKEYVERAYQVIELKKTHKTDRNHFFYIPFNCTELELLNNIVIQSCEKIENKRSREHAIQNWVYIVNNNSEVELYHTHIDLIDGDSRIKTDWTFCFYIQVPDSDGKISFKTEDNIEHEFLPEEGDIYIFPPDLLHTPRTIHNFSKDRILIAGNISLNPLKKINDKNIF